MRVFRGSYAIVDEIDLSKGRNNLDFGKGFYVTTIRSQAELWAARAGRLNCVVPGKSITYKFRNT